MTDHLARLGTLGFTYRTRRLADRLAESGRRLYDGLEVPLEPNWLVLLSLIERQGSVSVTEAATALRISHPAVSELARRMEDKGLVTGATDPADGRRRVLALSERGQASLPEFERLWSVIGKELDDILDSTAGGDALACIDAIERMLDERELDERVLRRLERGERASQPQSRSRRPAIRPVAAADRAAVLHITHELVRTADTYAFDPDPGDDELWAYWSPPQRGAGSVAELDGTVVGCFVIRPNNPGPGSHVANASYAVRADMRGMGVGRRMGEASLEQAVDLGYRAMQFNSVVSTNTAAVRLWRSLGFRIVGTVPDGFRLPDGTTVPFHVMHRSLP